MIKKQAGHQIMARTENMTEMQWIEQVARTCYKSEDKITADGQSAFKLVTNLMKRKHHAMIEHAHIILEVDYELYMCISNLSNMINELDPMNHLYLKFSAFNKTIVSGNIRAWRQFIECCQANGYEVPRALLRILSQVSGREVLFGDVFDVEEYRKPGYLGPGQAKELSTSELSKSEMYVHCPLTIKWTCDRGVSHELVRHRDASFAQESTRYVNYAKEKYGSECTFIDLHPGMQLDKVVANLPAEKQMTIYEIWCEAMQYLEVAYMQMIESGATPQIARSVLPNSTKTEVVMTATLDEWVRFFTLRLPDAAHPQMREITHGAYDEVQSMFPQLFKGRENFLEQIKNM